VYFSLPQDTPFIKIGLGAYMKTRAAVPTRVIAGEGNKMRTSPVLVP
jgi:hypothetical protein